MAGQGQQAGGRHPTSPAREHRFQCSGVQSPVKPAIQLVKGRSGDPPPVSVRQGAEPPLKQADQRSGLTLGDPPRLALGDPPRLALGPQCLRDGSQDSLRLLRGQHLATFHTCIADPDGLYGGPCRLVSLCDREGGDWVQRSGSERAGHSVT